MDVMIQSVIGFLRLLQKVTLLGALSPFPKQSFGFLGWEQNNLIDRINVAIDKVKELK
jgi:hypothetical protein